MKIITNALSARRPDWKRKREVKVMPPRKPGDPNPVLRASIERDIRHIWHGWGAEFEPPRTVGRNSARLGSSPRGRSNQGDIQGNPIAHARSPGAP